MDVRKYMERLREIWASIRWEKWKKAAMWMLRPGAAVTLLLVIVSAALLAVVFGKGWQESALAYITYPLSAWALTAAVAEGIPMVGRVKAWVLGSVLWKYAGNQKIRESVTMLSGLGISLFYAVFKLATGFLYHSVWLGAVAVYYIVLAVMRYLLMRYTLRKGVTMAEEWRVYRLTGALMLLLTLTISGMAVQMVRDNQAYTYPGVVIYASAAYTFYSLTMAIIQLVRYRKAERPLLTAVRVVTFAVALMAMFALQTGLIDQFGAAEGEVFRMTMNALTGGFVCLTTFACGLKMLMDKERKSEIICGKDDAEA